MLVRDGDHSTAPLEVLMVRRNLRSAFIGGGYVFPGGAVDPADGGAEAEDCCAGRSDRVASELLGLPSGGLAYWVAALRECFEEAGILLAYPADGGSLLSLIDQPAAARFLVHRAEVNDGHRRFLDVCRAEGLRLAVDQVHYFAHWITPEGAPRRFDTRFFVAAAPAGQTAAHDAAETIADEWVRPADALARHREGEIEMMLPTIHTLQAMGGFDNAADLVAAAAAAGKVPTNEPKVIIEGRGARILLPGDPGYDDAVATPAPDGSRSFEETARAVSRAANPKPAGERTTGDDQPG
jgi:8-oxo-dGTP pyrophosphatase MutT (NUDIX family)